MAKAFLPNIGGLVQIRRLNTLKKTEGGRSLINIEYLFEALVDKIVFSIGPLVASDAAISTAPQVGIFLCIFFHERWYRTLHFAEKK